MKNKSLIFILFIVLGNVFYQIGYKLMPDNLNSIAVIFIIYLFGFILSLITVFLYDYFNKEKTKKIFLKLKVPYFFALIMLIYDFGYLFVYRLGGNLSKVYTLMFPMKAISLAVLGVLMYKEKLNKQNVVGIVLGIAGVVLLSI